MNERGQPKGSLDLRFGGPEEAEGIARAMAASVVRPISEEQIKHMTERFLSWKLPADFNPDCGISAQRPNYGPNVVWEPMGTNLLDYTQAEAMVRHMLDGLPS
jgi:hypothetical protein